MAEPSMSSSKARMTLLSMPLELLHQISQELPLESAVALCLVSKKALFTFPLTKLAFQLVNDTRARVALLRFLLLDIRKQCFHGDLCAACGRIYYVENRPLPGLFAFIIIRLLETMDNRQGDIAKKSQDAACRLRKTLYF